MAKFQILTDSSCDLPENVANNMHIRVVPLSVFSEGKQYLNYLDGSDIGFDEFYGKLSGGAMITTSAVNVAQFRTVMEAELLCGHDVLYLGFSSALSGTYNAAVTAAKELEPLYPNKKIITVDTLSASLGEGLLVYLAVLRRREGQSIEQVAEYIESIKSSICHWFTVDDLNHLKRGGRISGVTAAIGSVLGIKPIMHVDDRGKLVSIGKARGRNAAINTLFERFCETATDPEKQTVFISHGNCRADAERLAYMIKEKYGCRFMISYIGPVIGTHSGQGTLALFFIGKER